MNYRIELYDTSGRRVAVFDEVPLIEAVRSAPDQPDTIRGLLPAGVTILGHGYRVRVIIDGHTFCDAWVTRIAPQWSDTRKLILDRYVSFHEVVEFEAVGVACRGNAAVSRGFANRSVSAMVRSVINSAIGPVHYLVNHTAYPDGAQREFAKFVTRRTSENELQLAGIDEGQWVGPGRIDASAAYARDGDTIAGLVVDGVPWPDVRLMMIDSEELSRNSHAVKRHPEVADWSADRYTISGYALRAQAARDALQALIHDNGIDFIELNPHRDTSGAFDDRVDAYGRYIALAYGAGQCLNAAMVETGHADIYLYNDGKYHVPEMELKDYFSYTAPNADSIEACPRTLAQFDVSAGLMEVLTALAYAGGAVWSIDNDRAVRFRVPQTPDRVVFFDPLRTWVSFGSDSSNIANIIYLDGNPVAGTLEKTYYRWPSVDEYGANAAHLNYYPLSLEEDADIILEGLLDDVAYPEVQGFIEFLHGEAHITVGDLLEIRDGPVRRLDHPIDGTWGGRFLGRHIGRVSQVTHRFSGRQTATRASLTSPLRSVSTPLTFITRGQEPASSLYQFRLDEPTIGLDLGYHLD